MLYSNSRAMSPLPWLCSLSQEEQLTTIHKQDTTERILERGGEAEGPPVTQRQTVVESKINGYIGRHGLSPMPGQHHVETAPWAFGSSSGEKRTWGKKEPGEQPSPSPTIVGCYVGAPTLISGELQGFAGESHPLGIVGESQTLGIWLRGSMGKGLPQLVHGSWQSKLIPGGPKG